MTARWPCVTFYLVLLLAIALDQATKAWAMASLRPLGSVLLVPGLFDLTYVQNTGIAFGMFAGKALLMGLFVFGLVVVALYYVRDVNWARWQPNVLGGSLVGGALGNLLDRFRQGYVVDFFDVHWGIHRWPVFNVADSLICIAVAWIVIGQLSGKAR